MKRLNIVLVILLVGFTTSWFITMDYLEKANDEISERLGDEFVFNGDTLIIVDYSIINLSYRLSNGVDVNYKLVEKNNK